MKFYYSNNKFIYLDRLLILILGLLFIIISIIKLVKPVKIIIEPIVFKFRFEEYKEEIIIEEKTVEEPIEVESQNKAIYRMTYYFTNDNTNSGETTASGLKTSQFGVNSNGWYTYKGKLVVATASKRLLSWEKYKNSTQEFYKLYDELVLTINGIDYEAIVLDVCGACMMSKKIDLFVKNRESGLDTQIEVRKEF